MPVMLNAYLKFQDRAQEAMEFYQSVLGGELSINTYGSFGAEDPAEQDKVMHAQLEAENGMVLMASDNPSGMPYQEGSNFSLSLTGDDEVKLRGYWDALIQGGAIVMDLGQAPWGDYFGMLTDKFGVSWMLDIEPAAA